MTRRTGIILLAAGGSRRLGVVVVLGAEENDCREELRGLDVEIVVNAHWADGMGASLATGAASLDTAHLNSFAIMLCDQPLIQAADLKALHAHWKSSAAPLAATNPPEGGGPPAIFAIEFLSQFRNFHGDTGARTLIAATPGATFLPLPHAAIDLDTPEDLVSLM